MTEPTPSIDAMWEWACINCQSVHARSVSSYWYGNDEVGPFCEACDRLIKQHRNVTDQAALRGTMTDYTESPEGQAAMEQAEWDARNPLDVPFDAAALQPALDYAAVIVVESDGYPMAHSAADIRTLLVNAFLSGMEHERKAKA